MRNYSKLMRVMRTYVRDSENELKKYTSNVEAIDPYRGSAYYSDRMDELSANHTSAQRALKSKIIDEASKLIGEMRENAAKRIATAPTADMMNSLSVLETLDTITVRQMESYAAQMKECPIAMQKLQQIGRKRGLTVKTRSPDELIGAIDRLEDKLSTFIMGFNGDISQGTFTARWVHQFLQSDEYYTNTTVGSTENADRAFWNEIAPGISPEALDSSDGGDENVTVEFFFKSFDGLKNYIESATFKSTDPEATESEILAKCPEQYREAYKIYKATGKYPDEWEA